MTMTMSHTEKQFLFNCGDDDWTDTWFDIFPEEVLQIIYKYLNQANLEAIKIPRPVKMYTQLSSRLTPDNYLDDKIICDKYGIISQQYYDSTGRACPFEQKIDVFNDLFAIKEEDGLKLHDLKIKIAKLVGKNANSEEITVNMKGGVGTWYDSMINKIDYCDNNPFYQCINHNGFKYRLDYINSGFWKGKYTFAVGYCNSNAGTISFSSREWTKKETIKTSKVTVSHEDLSWSELKMSSPQLIYYDTYGTKWSK